MINKRKERINMTKLATGRTGLYCLCFIAVVSQTVEGNYDICYDDTSQTYLACHPSLFDVFWYQTFKVSVEPAGSTCGSPASTFMRLGDRRNTELTCDASSETSRHPPSYIVDDSSTTWWQSINQSPGTSELRINITLSFNKTFRMAGDMIITFNSGRPDKMILEKSVDFGATWTPLQFYARSCDDFADQLIPGAAITAETPDAVVCSNRYVELSRRPNPGGTVKFSNDDRFNIFLGPLGVNLEEFYTALQTKLMDFLQFTDLRIQLIQPATDGLNNYDRYYYGISDMQAAARCYCNLHAAHCNYTDTDVICDCQHNTMGKNCETCMPLYNERPWQGGSYLPFDTGTANECQNCECNDHALSCTYNATYGRGICDTCLHNTRGYHCELCIFTYYPNISLPLNDIDRCTECDCELLGVRDNNLVCAQEESPGFILGQCMCRPLTTGRRCEQCIPGYYGLLTGPTVGQCTECNCTLDGTVEQSNTCEQDGGQCPCKPSITGRACDTCADGFYSFPTGTPQRGCLNCGCDRGGSLGSTCDKVSGNCSCRTNIAGDKCDQASPGNYVPAIDVMKYEPQQDACEVTSDLNTESAPFDGPGFSVCELSTIDTSVPFPNVRGGMIQRALQWPYFVAIRYSGNGTDITGTLTVQVTGDAQEELSTLSTRLGQIVTPGCPMPVGPMAQIDLEFQPGTSVATLSSDDTVALDARCAYSMTLDLRQIVNTPTEPPQVNETTGSSTGGGINSTSEAPARKKRATIPESSIIVDSLVLLPALSNADGSVAFEVYATAENQNVTQETYMSCLQQVSSLSSRTEALEQPPCKELLFSIAADLHDGGKECSCDGQGTDAISSSCQSLGGQCQCKPGVGGRACDACIPGYYNFSETGCVPCSCDSNGAVHGACDAGQCPCRSNIVQLNDDPSTVTIVSDDNTTTTVLDGSGRPIVIDGTCRFCRPNYYGIASGNGCSPCDCNPDGSTSLQCDATGQCLCKDSVTGMKCDICKDEFFSFGPEGCSACNCSTSGSTSANCDQSTGECTCRANVEGAKCADCKAGFFNMEDYNPNGCQPCFCYGHGESCTSASGFVSSILQVSSPTTPDHYKPLHGDRHTSYGRTVTMWISAGLELDLSGEMLITFKGYGKTLHHRGGNGPVLSPGQTVQYQVPLLEKDWLMSSENGSVIPSAVDIMGILADLTEVSHITSSQGQAVTVSYISLESAVPRKDANAGTDVMFVEECSCVAADNVGGLSCEGCATGHRRENMTAFTSYDICVPCNCSERGATDPPQCDEITGVCLNCRNGTTGDQCENCANNVIGDECDICETEYWGLQADGCRACNCSDPGSTSTVCDVDSGQCPCAEHVVGRTCDECEENYQGLSASGCVECDACFSLMKDAILPLREKRDYIKSNVTLMNQQDINDEVGPFTARLASAEAQMEKLINFLTSAEESEAETMRQIESVNATLQSIVSQMDVIEMNSTSNIEGMLGEIESFINTANSHRTVVETQVRANNGKLANLQAGSVGVADLAASLQAVENYLQSLADASTADQEILSQLNTLNVTVASANQKANDALKKAQDALNVHHNTTSSLLMVDKQVLTLVTKSRRVLTSARNLATTDTNTKNTIARLEDTLASVSGVAIDYTSFASRTSNALSTTSSLQSQVAAESGLFGPSNLRALETVAIVANLTNETQASGFTSADWLWRSRNAEQRALVIQNEANQLYQTAKDTLDTVANFSVKVADVQQKANQSLEQVASLATLSQQLMDESGDLTTALVALKQNASAAKETSQQALQMIQDKHTQLLALSTEAEQLQTRLSTMEDNSGERYTDLNNTRVNIVEPAQLQCENLNTSVTAFREQLATTESTISEAAQQIANVTRRANEVLVFLRSLSSVNTTAIEELLTRVLASQSNMNVPSLQASVNALQTSRSDQRAQITRMQALKEDLKARIQSLKTLQAQAGSS